LTETFSSFEMHARAAVEALRADLLNGGYRRSYPADSETPPSR